MPSADHQPGSVATPPSDEVLRKQTFGNLESNLGFLEPFLDAGAEMLDIGSGRGPLVYVLRSRGYRIRGVEIDPSLVAEGRSVHGDLPISVVDDERLPFEAATFDLVMSFDVFEHIPNSDGHLAEVWRVLKPGGTYVLQTPNKWTNVPFETVRWRSFTKFREIHCSLHNYWQLRDRLARHGFDVCFHDVPVVNEFFRGKVRQHLGRPGLWLLEVANPDRLPMPLRTNFYVSARKHA